MRSAPMKPAREPVQTALDTLPLAALSRHSLISSTADGPPVEDGGAAAAGAAEGSCVDCAIAGTANKRVARSEEHTSELQSLMRISYAVFCLKKKTYNKQPNDPAVPTRTYTKHMT